MAALPPVLQPTGETPHVRRKRYAGRNPRNFADKYKELRQDAAILEHVSSSGRTPAGTHRPIMVSECLEALALRTGHTVCDATLGFGGHACEMLAVIGAAGRLIGLDADGESLTRTAARLRQLGHNEETATFVHTNYAALAQVVFRESPNGCDAVIADLGLSSMQIDDPDRGMTWKTAGPLDMRLDRSRGKAAAALLASITRDKLEELLISNADEPHAAPIAAAVAGQSMHTTADLNAAVRRALPRGLDADAATLSVRRTFQAVRIAVNDEFSKLDALLAALPLVLKPGGRVAIMSFHSGEDRRVKLAFRDGHRSGTYSLVSDVIRPSALEQNTNPRSRSAKLRWAVRAV